MILVVLEFSETKTLPYRTLIFPEKDFCFNRLFEQNEYSRATVTEGHSLVIADITCMRGDPIMKRSNEDLIAQVKHDLSKLPFISLDKISDVHVEKVEYAYVVPCRSTRRAYSEIQHELKGISNLNLMGRFATGEYDNSDYAIDSGLALGAYLAGKTTKLEYLSSLHEKKDRNIVG